MRASERKRRRQAAEFVRDFCALAVIGGLLVAIAIIHAGLTPIPQ